MFNGFNEGTQGLSLFMIHSDEVFSSQIVEDNLSCLPSPQDSSTLRGDNGWNEIKIESNDFIWVKIGVENVEIA